MAGKSKRFADDGWAFWVEGEDTSTVYINDWINPKGKNYVDIAIRIRGIGESKSLFVYVPFPVLKEEIEDVSLLFSDKNILQATFSAACIVDFKKNEHVSEIAYHGKTVDVIHIAAMDFTAKELTKGTLLNLDLEQVKPYLDNDEAYLIWRMPHKSLDEVFKPCVDMGNALERLRDLITTPVVAEKYGYSVRVNEARSLPDEITRIGAFHRQKLKKAVVSISIHESYELNDAGCHRIRRLEENLYQDYLPKDFSGENVITYQWKQSREHNLMGHFTFYNNIVRNSVSKSSMILYMILLVLVGMMSDLIWDIIKSVFGIF